MVSSKRLCVRRASRPLRARSCHLIAEEAASDPGWCGPHEFWSAVLLLAAGLPAPHWVVFVGTRKLVRMSPQPAGIQPQHADWLTDCAQVAWYHNRYTCCAGQDQDQEAWCSDSAAAVSAVRQAVLQQGVGTLLEVRVGSKVRWWWPLAGGVR